MVLVKRLPHSRADPVWYKRERALRGSGLGNGLISLLPVMEIAGLAQVSIGFSIRWRANTTIVAIRYPVGLFVSAVYAGFQSAHLSASAIYRLGVR